MRFLPAFKYRMRDCLISMGVVILVMVGLTVLSHLGIVTFGGYEQSVDGVVTEHYATMNFTMPYTIFMFVLGIVSIREDMRIGIQNGASRTTSFLANMACMVVSAVTLSANCVVFYKVWELFGTGLVIIDLYSAAFLNEAAPQTARPDAGGRPRRLWLRLASADAKLLRRIELLQEMFPGREQMIVYFADTGRKLAADCVIKDSLVRELRELLGEENVKVV